MIGDRNPMAKLVLIKTDLPPAPYNKLNLILNSFVKYIPFNLRLDFKFIFVLTVKVQLISTLGCVN